MGAPLHAAIHDDVDLIADRVDDFRQLVKAAARAVKLTPAMVGHHDAGAADVDRPPGVLDGHDALETELTVPMPDHFRDVVPIHFRIVHVGEVAADRHDAAAHIDMAIELGKRKYLIDTVVRSEENTAELTVLMRP